MVNGRLRCLGSAQHLKLRFGDGFEVNVKTLSPSAGDIIALAQSLVRRGVLQLQGTEGQPDEVVINSFDDVRVVKQQLTAFVCGLDISIGPNSVLPVDLLELATMEGGAMSLKVFI